MRERRPLVGAIAALVLLAIGTQTRARQDDPRETEGLRRRRPAASGPLLPPPDQRRPAPAIPRGLEWLQGTPMSPGDLRGRVVLVDFWELTCVNCLRVLPRVEDLRARYAASGLTAIAVHAPDFAFSADPAEVAAAAKRLGVTAPLVNDPQMKAWRAFDNNGWPSAFLIDAAGRMAWRGTGEEAYAGLEERVRELLREAGARELPAPSGMPLPDPSGQACGRTTPEVYLGHARGALANIEGYAPGEVRVYAPPPEILPGEGQPLLAGAWFARADGIASGAAGRSSLSLIYEAKDVFAVLRAPAGGTHVVEVTQDGRPLGPEQRGRDMTIDAAGRSVVTVDASRLYAMVANRRTGRHRIDLVPRTEQIQILSFTFGNDCQAVPARC